MLIAYPRRWMAFLWPRTLHLQPLCPISVEQNLETKANVVVSECIVRYRIVTH